MAVSDIFTDFKRGLILLIASLNGLLVPVLAQGESAKGSIESTLTNALRYAFGISAASADTWLWVRLGVFVLSLTVIATLVTNIELFKENQGAGMLIAIIISYMGIRFIPDQTLFLIVLWMPFVVMFASFYVFYLMWNKSSEKGLSWLMMWGVLLGIAGWAIWGITSQMEQEFGHNEMMDWAYLISVLIIFASVALVAILTWKGTGQFSSKIKAIFRSDAAAVRDISAEESDVHSEAELNAKEKEVSNKMIEIVEKVIEHMSVKDYNSAKTEAKKLKKELDNFSKLVSKQIKKAIEVKKHVVATQKQLKKVGAEDRDEGLLDEAATVLESIENKIRKLNDYETKVDTIIAHIVGEGEGQIIKFINYLDAGDYEDANTELENISQEINKLSEDVNLLNNRLFPQLEKLTKIGEAIIEFEEQRDKDFAETEKEAKELWEKMKEGVLDIKGSNAATSARQYFQDNKEYHLMLTREEDYIRYFRDVYPKIIEKIKKDIINPKLDKRPAGFKANNAKGYKVAKYMVGEGKEAAEEIVNKAREIAGRRLSI